MHRSLIVAAGWFALVMPAQPPTQPPGGTPTPLAPLPQTTAVKLRLEIELQGVLKVTDKEVTLTHKETRFEYVKNPVPHAPGSPDLVLENREVDRVWVLQLDDNQKKAARDLHGKDVVVTGKVLVLGINAQAQSGKTAPTIGSRIMQNPRGGPPTDVPTVIPEGIATTVHAQLQLDDHVTVVSVKAAK
jgi:hypothetical protein